MHTVFYSDDYCLPKHGFDTTMKSRWIADSLAAKPIPGVELVSPPPASRDDIERVHAADYVEAIKTGEPDSVASSSGLPWCEHTYTAAIAHAGGMIAAVRQAIASGLAGSLSAGMHHARRNHGLGFCTFNSLVVAAAEAERLGRQNVLILDLDAHGGGGTASLLAPFVRTSQLDLVVDPFDTHEDSIDLSTKSRVDYLTVLDRCLEELDPDFVIYNAGMDIHETDCGPPGFDAKIIAAREATVFSWAASRGVPLCYALAGGYTSTTRPREVLVAHHRCTLRAAEQIYGQRLGVVA